MQTSTASSSPETASDVKPQEWSLEEKGLSAEGNNQKVQEASSENRWRPIVEDNFIKPAFAHQALEQGQKINQTLQEGND